MQNRYLPPLRRSILQLGEVKFLGPHHFINRFGIVHAFHTRSLGASNMRTIINSFLSETAVPELCSEVLCVELIVCLLHQNLFFDSLVKSSPSIHTITAAYSFMFHCRLEETEKLCAHR